MLYYKFLNKLDDIGEIFKKHYGSIFLGICLIIVFLLLGTGTRPLFIMSESMVPVLHKDTIVIGKIVKDTLDLQVGDICTYENPEKGYTITHRIIEDNGTTFTFKGDNNEKEDLPVSKDWIKYKVIWYPKL